MIKRLSENIKASQLFPGVILVRIVYKFATLLKKLEERLLTVDLIITATLDFPPFYRNVFTFFLNYFIRTK